MITLKSNTCSECGRTHPDIGDFAEMYRTSELNMKRSHPGNLCGFCAAQRSIDRIVTEKREEAFSKIAPKRNGHGLRS